jgi:NADPH:quinone reductase-like Zn-dependent oxidoreductase
MSLVTSATFFLGLGLSAPLIMSALGLFRRSLRTTQIPPTQERVLVLGASSGIGRSIAHAYAARGARVCVVGRREKELASVVGECEVRAREVGHITNGEKRVISAVADFTNAEDMVRVRDLVERGSLLLCLGSQRRL